ncbi:GDP-mannose 4-6-dehydratase [Apiospora phragmitis]|uniref:GDP-mannose 4,6-dehydratase n=1 Tax=Apiospora phragmitis TaxID=2905665 RepID=A0ABR1TNR9_9PEZI
MTMSPRETHGRKSAFITGITGQDGFYLSQLLLDKNYVVHGLVRPSSRTYHNQKSSNIDCRVIAHHGDVLDQTQLRRTIAGIRPDEVYHLAAQSHVPTSLALTEYTVSVVAMGTLNVLNILVDLRSDKEIKLLNACSSEIFCRVAESPQTELTPFRPMSPYAVAKEAAYWLVSNAREDYGIFAASAISFNHESPIRREYSIGVEARPDFVSRKITWGVAAIALGFKQSIVLGNLDARRDWSHARDLVCGMHALLQLPEPVDMILASGESHSVRDVVEAAFGVAYGAEQSTRWRGTGNDEIGTDKETGIIRVKVSETFRRPLDVQYLQGSAGKAKARLGWVAETKLHELVREMVQSDLNMLSHGPNTKSHLLILAAPVCTGR